MRGIVAAIAVVLAASCATAREESPHVAPPTSGPGSVDDVVGIWRNVHQGVLELRQNGSYVLISPITEPEAGRFKLDGDRLEVRAEKGCGAVPGDYRVLVSRSRRMDLSDGTDGCADRHRVMLGDPWIYTPR